LLYGTTACFQNALRSSGTSLNLPDHLGIGEIARPRRPQAPMQTLRDRLVELINELKSGRFHMAQTALPPGHAESVVRKGVPNDGATRLRRKHKAGV